MLLVLSSRCRIRSFCSSRLAISRSQEAAKPCLDELCRNLFTTKHNHTALDRHIFVACCLSVVTLVSNVLLNTTLFIAEWAVSSTSVLLHGSRTSRTLLDVFVTSRGDKHHLVLAPSKTNRSLITQSFDLCPGSSLIPDVFTRYWLSPCQAPFNISATGTTNTVDRMQSTRTLASICIDAWTWTTPSYGQLFGL